MSIFRRLGDLRFRLITYVINSPLINQLVRAATSVGSNYCEADCAESKKDFIHKISICKKEAKEVQHWFKMIVTAIPESRDKAQRLKAEARELMLIFIVIVSSTKTKKDN